MSLTELLPSLQALSRAEKVHLIQLLFSDLGEDEGGTAISQGIDYPIWSPIEASEAAATLLRELDSDRGRHLGQQTGQLLPGVGRQCSDLN